MEDKYLIVEQYCKDQLQIEVNKLIEKGYVPFGCLVVTSYREYNRDYNCVIPKFLYTQPMIQKYLKDSL